MHLLGFLFFLYFNKFVWIQSNLKFIFQNINYITFTLYWNNKTNWSKEYPRLIYNFINKHSLIESTNVLFVFLGLCLQQLIQLLIKYIYIYSDFDWWIVFNVNKCFRHVLILKSKWDVFQLIHKHLKLILKKCVEQLRRILVW